MSISQLPDSLPIRGIGVVEAHQPLRVASPLVTLAALVTLGT